MLVIEIVIALTFLFDFIYIFQKIHVTILSMEVTHTETCPKI